MEDLTLKHGIFLAPFHANEESPTLAIQRDLQLADWLDSLGFNELWIGEHHSGGFETIASPELFIAAAAERTRRIRFGTGVVSLPYHNPFMVASRIVQLDHQTFGRIMLGTGPGLLTTDARMLNLDTQKSRDRTVEALDIIIRLMNGEVVTHHSEWIDLVEARLQLRPYQRPYPEVAVASSISPSGARAAGRFGGAMLCVAAADRAGFDTLSTNWTIANEVAAQYGKTMKRESLRLVAAMHIAETREKARQNVRFGLQKYFDYHNKVAPGRYPQDGDGVDFILDSGSAAIGTPDDAIALIERLQERQGGFGVMLTFANNWADWEETKRSYELYARYVVPHFSKANLNRAASLDAMSETSTENERLRRQAVQAMIDKHKSEYKNS